MASNRRIEELLRLDARVQRLARGASIPCFGHLEIETAEGTTDVFLGLETRSGAGFSLVDFRASPLAAVYFGGIREGECYELTRGDRTVSGTLLKRTGLRHQDGELVEIVVGETCWRRAATGEWTCAERALAPRLKPRPRSSRRHPGLEDELVLDPAQREAVELPAGEALLVLGEAGCGKTTVALHRLAHLRRRNGRLSAAVIVPTDGLRRLVELLLSHLAVAGVEVWLYDAWAAAQARQAFPDLPGRESQDASAAVLQLKRDPALLPLLAEQAALPAALPDEDEATTPTPALVRRHDLQRLFDDRALLSRVFTASAIRETCEHTRVQFSLTAEDEYSYVDRARLLALDRRKLDEGTPMGDAATMDAEDSAVLFELDRLRAAALGGAATAPRSYGCLVVDEAQELSPLELRLIGRSLMPGGTLVVAGDADQQIDPGAFFGGWETSMAELGAARHRTSTLGVSYRCPPEVTALARGVLGSNERSKPSVGSKVSRLRLPGPFSLLEWMVAALRDLQERDRGASVAVICRTGEAAREWTTLLRLGVPVRLALDGDFSLRAGINVTCIEEVKGLEFDVVVVPDSTPESWPDTLATRRALYVALTRASRQLVVATPGEWSPLLK